MQLVGVRMHRVPTYLGEGWAPQTFVPTSPLTAAFPGAARIGTLDRVVSARGGLVSTVVPLAPAAGSYRICQAVLGDVAGVLPGLAGISGRGALDGAGSGDELVRAADLAVVEAVERWSSTVVTPDQLVTASTEELGDTAIDMATVPRCSADELAHPRCPLVPFAPDQRMRWVTGLDLTTGEPVLVPAVMTYLGMAQLDPAERWWLPISTGCAAHTDLAAALAGGLLEVVERDALSLTWLHRLPLPELELDLPEVAEAAARANRPGAGHTRLFDATLDTGIPTVYAVNRSSGPVATVVGAATAADASTAARKVLREVQSCRIALESAAPVGDDPDRFISATDGALWMAAPDRVREFDFLTEGTARRPISSLPVLPSRSPVELLRAAVAAVRAVGGRPVAVDLTTREARRAGLHVVRVIVPELQPMTFSLRARYLAHPRVQQGPAAAGHRPLPPAELNPLPQPMA
jgi:ribosomal protein S12 methylthiotransferase accessory factor